MNTVTKIKTFIVKELCLFIAGGLLYVIFENVWRGHSHSTMIVVGGLCFILIGLINEILTENMSLLAQSVVGACAVTIIEFISGCIINIHLGLNVWDYSDMPFNIMGQICLPYSLLWIIVACIAIVADDRLRWIFFNEPKVTYHLFPKWKKYSENKK